MKAMDTATERLGERLTSRNLVTADQLHIALEEQKHSKDLLGQTLLRLGFLREEILQDELADRTGLQRIDVKTTAIDTSLLKIVPKDLCVRHNVLPLKLTDEQLDIAVADPYDIMAFDKVRQHLPRSTRLNLLVANQTDIQSILKRAGSQTTGIQDILSDFEPSIDQTAINGFEHPIIRLVNNILHDAIERGASDIHFEPESSFIRVRYRIDGVLRQTHALHLKFWSALSHRIKIMANMNIADTRSIQDGRFQVQAEGRSVDCRAAIMPSVWGETIALRLLDHRQSLLSLDELGYSQHARSRIDLMTRKPQGITLITGPTGSGKTTTLYAILRQISSVEVNIATLEEPVEYQLDLIRQTPIQDMQGVTFATGVRGILRMDPDIILIGEVRDAETAQMALRAAMTGHQVYTTLHCNDAIGAIPRLLDLGLGPRLIAENLSGLVAQRLVRTLCPHCKTKRRTNEEERALLGGDDSTIIAEPKGCELCDFTGRKGRAVIAQTIPFTQSISELVSRDATRREIAGLARTEGMITMQEEGLNLVRKGLVTFQDLARVIDLTEVGP